MFSQIFLNGLSNSFGRQLQPGDTVGCGLNDRELLIYYTINGKPSGVVHLDGERSETHAMLMEIRWRDLL